MLEVYILTHLMKLERRSNLKQGRLLGFSLTHFREAHEIPKGTFYRALSELIYDGFVIKQKRGFYLISDEFRGECNRIKQADLVSSL